MFSANHELGEELAALVVIAWIAADRRQRIGREGHEVLQCEAPSHVFRVRIEAAVLVDHDRTGQLRRGRTARVRAEGSNQVAAD